MVCSKCGYAVSRGQSNCVYCGNKVVPDAAKTDSTAARRTTSAFAKQLKSSQSDGQAVKTSAAAEKAEQKSADTTLTPKSSPFLAAKQPQASAAVPGAANTPFARQTADAPASKPQVIAPYAVRPMHTVFDPNSEDSPFVRKPLEIEADVEPETPQDQTVSQASEEKPEDIAADVVSEEVPATEVSVEESPKKKFSLPIAALTLVFVSLAIFVFSNF